jgi:hypothetical protein
VETCLLHTCGVRTLLVLTLMLGSAAAFARGPMSVCEEEEPAPPRETRPVLPCALAESGELNADAACADATFYVVTPAGVLLCQIDVDLLVSGSSTTIERAPPAHAGSPMSSAVTALASHGVDLPVPVAWLRPSSADTASGGPRDGFGWAPPSPS